MRSLRIFHEKVKIMILASFAEIFARKNRYWRRCLLSLEDTGFVRLLLHESKLKCMPKRKTSQWVQIALENFAKIPHIL